ncbi:hypothetical protein [Gracilimonas sediminicola]|uniref:Uncharacterized protein n=1 Tax=Gracilimonas sediminicola TaxID=2952158 RepID=A0A9X2L1L3_9BACT|nr:hypothetical protein [Gracilimonas sediminicola]MCP9290544.1 hypothetical protein [Gracilimonas sediminicola]
MKKNRKELEKPIDPEELILTEEEISDLSDLQKERRYGAVLPDDHILLLQKHRNAKRILYYLANLHGSKMHLPKSSNTGKGKVSKFIKSFFPQ